MDEQNDLKCACCEKEVSQHALAHYRAIKRKDAIYCVRCICEKSAGDFPTIGEYRILHKLGKGGNADVYLAVQVNMYRLVAFKWLKNMLSPSPEKIHRFARECEIGAKLVHPNVVQFYDAGHKDNTYFIVMEFVNGDTLEQILTRKGRLSVKEVTQIALQLIGALDFAYKEHIVHRDLKPSNIFVDKSGLVKLSDFGIAKYFDEVGLSQMETRSGMTMGTMPYMPPEQFGSAKYTDQRADIYSYGATLYHLLTGRVPLPVEGMTLTQYLGRLIHKNPELPSAIVPNVPEVLERTIMKCLEKKPEERFQEPLEIRNLLKEVDLRGLDFVPEKI